MDFQLFVLVYIEYKIVFQYLKDIQFAVTLFYFDRFLLLFIQFLMYMYLFEIVFKFRIPNFSYYI